MNNDINQKEHLKGICVLKQVGMIILIVGLTGCVTNDSTMGVYPNTEKLNQIHLNKSSKEEVEKVLGKPKKIIFDSDDTEHWIYKTTDDHYTDAYAAKKALSFAPVPFLGTALGVVDTSPSKTGVTHTLSLIFTKKGVLQDIQREVEHF